MTDPAELVAEARRRLAYIEGSKARGYLIAKLADALEQSQSELEALRKELAGLQWSHKELGCAYAAAREWEMRFEAEVGTLRSEVARLTAERDQAILHDRQPYPTAWAYEAACAALNKCKAERDAMRPVVEAACAAFDEGWLSDHGGFLGDIPDAVRTYRAARGKP